MQEMRLVFPNSHRINRGNYVVKELADACRANDVTDLVVLHEHRGVPGILELYGAAVHELTVCRCIDCLPLSSWPNAILFAPQRRPAARHRVIQPIDRIRAISTSDLRGI